MKWAARAAMAVAALVSAAVTGCGNSPKPSKLPQAPSSASRSTSQDPEGAAVLAAYKGMWSDYEKDSSTANWQNPVSANHATGEALQDLENTLAVDGHHGWVGKGAAVLHPVVKSLPSAVSPTTAEVVDCADLSHFLRYVAATGALQDPNPGGWHLVDAEMVLKDGAWKVSTLAIGQVGSC